MCVLGLVLGIWRYGLTPRFRHKGVHSHSPYKGWMKWHHYAGLIFGLFTFTWMLSGVQSLGVIPFINQTPITAVQRDAAPGGPIDMSSITVDGLLEAVAAITPTFAPKELEFLQFQGKPYFIAYRPPSAAEVADWPTTSVVDLIAPTLTYDHVIVSATEPGHGTFERFEDDSVLEVARAAMPGVPIEDATWLDEYDPYYYDRLWTFDLANYKEARPLPVLRVRFDDPEGTWLYLNPFHGRMERFQAMGRVDRWLYYGLHGLDFSALYNRRPLWDIIVLSLLLGGTVLSAELDFAVL